MRPSTVRPSIRSQAVNPNFSRTNNASNVSDRLSSLYSQARRTGVLKLSDQNLGTFPKKISHLYDSENLLADEKHWENIDLTSLIMANCQLSNVDHEINLLNRLTSVVLSHNQISSLPNELFQLQELKKLDLQYNKLANIPEAIGDCSNLVDLQLNNNNLTSLPQSFTQLTALESLNLNENQLNSLPNSLNSMKNLTKFTVNNNNLSNFPAINQLAKLQLLECKKNSITRFSDLSGNVSLTILDCSENKMTDLPQFPSNSGSLQQVSFAFNQISDILPLTNSSNLSQIDLHNNKITNLPVEITKLQQLKHFDVSNNDLSDLQGELGLLPLLNKLLVEGNPLKKFPRARLTGKISELKQYLISRIDQSSESFNKIAQNNGNFAVSNNQNIEYVIRSSFGSKTLNLSKLASKLTDLPAELFEISPATIQSVDASDNLLRSVNPAILNYTGSLKFLSLANNQFSQFPAAVAQLTNLLELNLKQNQLSSLPSEIAWLSQLRLIDLRSNFFSEFPAQLLPIAPSLSHIYLGSNQISALNNVNIGEFINLQELDLENNKISNLCEGFRHLSRLQLLNLSNNNLSQIPLELGLLPAVSSLQIAGNPQRTVQQSVVQRGTPAVVEFLKNKIPPDSPLLISNNLGNNSVDRTKIGNNLPINNSRTQINSKNNTEDFPFANSSARPAASRRSANSAGSGNYSHAADFQVPLPEREQKALAPRFDPNAPIPAAQGLLNHANSSRVMELRGSVAALSEELENNLSLSSAAQHALKKKLAMEKAALMREERKLQ
jgi:Leucine-rich repeat (LRR) protein